MKQLKFYRLIKQISLIAFLFPFFFSACTDNKIEPDNEGLEVVEYELYSGEMMSITLDPNLIQETRYFKDEKELNDYRFQLEDESVKIILNKDMWNSLKHYMNPYEVVLLNSERKLFVGENEYKYENEFVMEKTPAEDWHMTFYFGKDGDAHVRDLLKANKAIVDDPKGLKEYTFKSPAARKRYEELMAMPKPEGFSQDWTLLVENNFNGDETFHYTGNLEIDAYPIEYIGRDGSTTVQAISRAVYMNEEYSYPFSKAAGATTFEIQDLHPTLGRYTFGEYVIPLTFSLHPGDVRPVTFVKVYSKKWREKRSEGFHVLRDGIARRYGQKVHSRHFIEFRNNNSDNRQMIWHLLRWD